MSPSDKVNIACAVIQVLGSIAAAVIGAFCATKFVSQTILPHFHNYKDNRDKSAELIQSATHDIYIVVASGTHLIRHRYQHLKSRLKSGVRIHYLLLDYTRFKEAESFIHAGPRDDKDLNETYMGTLSKLEALHEANPGMFEFRFFHSFMPVSYIGIDLDVPSYSDVSPVIQAMLYQYHVATNLCPATHLTPKENSYSSTIQSIKDMWNAADDKHGFSP